MGNHLKKAASGHLMKTTAGHLVDDCPCYTCAELAALTNWQADDYGLVGYNDGDLSACAGCMDDEGLLIAWDGKFTNAVDIWPGCWKVVSGGAWVSIDGKVLRTLRTWVGYSELTCAWELQIECYIGIFPPYNCSIWEGVKVVGTTPVGTYTRTAGNDLTPTLDIEVV